MAVIFRQTLKLAIEEAIYEKAPDTTGIEVEGVVAPAAPFQFCTHRTTDQE